MTRNLIKTLTLMLALVLIAPLSACKPNIDEISKNTAMAIQENLNSDEQISRYKLKVTSVKLQEANGSEYSGVITLTTIDNVNYSINGKLTFVNGAAKWKPDVGAYDFLSKGLTILDTPQPREYPITKKYQLEGNIRSYIQSSCENTSYISCEVFVQPDEAGSLIGFLVLKQSKEGSAVFESDTKTIDRRTCPIGGNFDGSIIDVQSDFKEQSEFTADNAIGVFYLTRKGNRIRLNDERWNYCYDEKYIDDVWYRAGYYIR